MNHEQLQETIPLYAVGALDRQERQTLETHLLSGCSICPLTLKDYRATVGLLPYALPPQALPPEFKTELMAALHPATPNPAAHKTAALPRLQPGPWLQHIIPPPPSWIPYPAVALVSLLLLAGTLWYAFSVRTQVQGEAAQRQQVETALHAEHARITALQQQVAGQERMLSKLRDEVTDKIGILKQLREALATREAEQEQLRAQLALRDQSSTILRRALAQHDELLALLHAPRITLFSLTGSERAKSAGATLLYDAESKKAVLYAFNLPPPPAGKIYQLWGMVTFPSQPKSESAPVSLGAFGTDIGRRGLLAIKNFPDPPRLAKLSVSLEPDGGKSQPTGDVYLTGPR
ncbi:MAG: hypothetical protein FJ246_02165 [Nitrospira sp.]|nr:hypothetical protein [Nitrospira sp.]